MSIWSSIGADAKAADMHSAEVGEYAATGPETVLVDVATATNHNDRIRLVIYGDDLDQCLSLSRDAAVQLRDNLNRALAALESAG